MTHYNRHSGNPGYHDMMHFGHDYFYPAYPIIGTVLLLASLRLIGYRLSQTRSALLAGGSYLLHTFFFDGVRNAYKDDIYDYGPVAIWLPLAGILLLVCAFFYYLDQTERNAFAARLGLDIADERINRSYDLLTDDGRKTAKTIAELDQLLARANELITTRKEHERLFRSEQPVQGRTTFYRGYTRRRH